MYYILGILCDFDQEQALCQAVWNSMQMIIYEACYFKRNSLSGDLSYRTPLKEFHNVYAEMSTAV